MGDIRVHGPAALAAVQHMTFNDASHLAIGQAQYSALLYPAGTFVDDVIVHRLADDDFLLVINAGTREKDVNWVREAAKPSIARSKTSATITPRSPSRAPTAGAPCRSSPTPISPR